MSVYSRAYAGCRGNRGADGRCSATISISKADLAEVEDLVGERAKKQALLELAAAGCKEGCKCKAGAARFVDDDTISATSNDPTS